MYDEDDLDDLDILSRDEIISVLDLTKPVADTSCKRSKSVELPSFVEEPRELTLGVDYFKIFDTPEELLPVIVDEEPGKVEELSAEEKIFLTHYLGSGVVTQALKQSGLSRKRYQSLVEANGRFARAVAAATEGIADSLEHEGLKQALTGNTKLLIKMLESYRPRKFGRVSTVQSLIQGEMNVNINSWAELSLQAEREVVDVTPVSVEGAREDGEEV